MTDDHDLEHGLAAIVGMFVGQFAAGVTRVASKYAALGSPPRTTRRLEEPNSPWRFRVAQKTCRRGDLNPHALAGTSPSS